jgi:hypothetical protein
VGDAGKLNGIPYRVFRDGARCLCLAARAASREVWLVFKVVGGFATALEVAARGEPMSRWSMGRWPFPPAPQAFVPHHEAYGVPSQLDMSLVLIAPGRDLPDLCLSFGDATGTVRPLESFVADSLPARPHGPGAGCAATPSSIGLLSWGFPKSAPPPTSPSRVHSRVDLF